MVLDEFKLTGIYDDVYDAGLKSGALTWREPKGKRLASTRYPDGRVGVQLEQYDLADILLKHLSRYPNVAVHFDTSFESKRFL